MGALMRIPCDFNCVSLYNIEEINSSFATGTLKVMYLGNNRNGSYFSKDAVRDALPSLKNVPIVCHWDDDAEEIGGHDITVVSDDDGSLRIKNLTEPCGVVPDHAQFSFQKDNDDDGNEHEYLVIDGVILWKRQDVYRYIVNELGGKVDHSMEITVLDGGKTAEGYYDIKKFEFTALCLLGNCEPCFQGSELELYSAQNFKEKMEQMMLEMRESFSMVIPPAGDDIHPQKDQTEGGRTELEDNNEKMEVTVEEPETEVVEPEAETPEEEVAEEPAAEEPAAEEPEAEEPEAEESGEATEEDTEPEFELACNLMDALRRALDSVKVHDEYGEWNKYWFVDFDPDKSEVYAEDTENWRLYGMSYTMDGDNAVIDFENRALKKWAIVDFIGEDDSDPLSSVFEAISKQVAEGRAAKSELCSLQEETEALRNYRDRVETEAKDQAKADLFAQFADLEGNEMFEALKADESDTDISVLEEKCYALRGRMNSPAKFAREVKTPRIKVDDERVDKSKDEPYGDLFAKYGDK